MPLSPSAALYVAADAVAPKDKKLSMGVAVPGRDVSVDLKSLSAILAAAALWSLRESGAATVEVEQKKGLLGTKQRVAVRPGNGGGPRSANEAAMLHWLDQKDPYARGLVHRWLQRESANPWGNVVAAFELELAEQGVLRPEEANGVKGKLGAFAHGRPKMTAVPEAVAAARPEADAVVARWQAFHAAEPELAEALVKECRAGIDNRLDTD